MAKTKAGESRYNFADFLPCPQELKAVSSPVTIVSEEQYLERLEVVEAKLKSSLQNSNLDLWGVGLPLTKRIQKEYIEKFKYDNWYDWQ